jgi:hypothetical protein
MKAYEGVGVQIQDLLTSALVAGEWSASRHGSFTLGETVPGTHWTEHWMGPRVCPDAVEKRKFLSLPGLELQSLNAQSADISSIFRRCGPTTSIFNFMNNKCQLQAVYC